MHKHSNGMSSEENRSTEHKMVRRNKTSRDIFVEKDFVSYYNKNTEEMLPKTKIKIPECSTRHSGIAKPSNTNVQGDTLGKNVTCHLDKYGSSPNSWLVSDKMQNKCNNYVQILKETSIQKTKIKNANSEIEYSRTVHRKDYDFSKLYYQRDVCYKAHSFSKETNLPYKPSYFPFKRFRNDILTLSYCVYELQTVFNYLLVIFILCQLSNLGIIKCVSCQESYSTFSYKQSRYQYPPYAPPSNLYNSNRFLASTRSDTNFREKNAHGIHPSGPNTLPLYKPVHANVSHFSEDAKIFTVFNLNGWGLRWPFGSDEEERFKLLRDYLRKTNYDFVLLQEVWYLSQYELLKGTLPYITDYQALNNGGCSGRFFIPLGCSGLVILSRHPILFAEVQPFSVRGNFWNFDGEILVGKGIGRTRVLLWNKYTIDLFTTHLVSYTNNPNRDNTWYRFLQSAQTAHAIKTSNADIKIFGGDINARPYLESDRQPYRMLRSVMVDSLIDRHSEESRFDPWFATFAHPTNTYGNGAMPERIDYLMYRCNSNIKMRTYDFKLPLLMGKDASGQAMSVSDHEAMHAEFIIEMQNVEGQTRQTDNNYNPRYTKKSTYYPTDRSGLSYDDLLGIKDERVFVQDPYSEYGSYEFKMPEEIQKSKNGTSQHTIKVASNVNNIESHRKDGSDRIKNKYRNVKATVKKEFDRVLQYDKYHQVLYLLNLTSDPQTAEFESNRIK